MDKKSHKLKIINTSDFLLVGISSHENDYRLSWAMNNFLEFKLSKADNLKNYNEQLGINQEFSVFNYDNEEIQYNLISNRCDNGFLIGQLKNIDYFLLLKGEGKEKVVDEVISKIRKIDLVTTAFLISKPSIKLISIFNKYH